MANELHDCEAGGERRTIFGNNRREAERKLMVREPS